VRPGLPSAARKRLAGGAERSAMPSTLVHAAVGALLAAALLAEAFDGRSVGVVVAAVAAVDLDTFIGLVVPGLHRAATHTFVLPAALGLVLYLDLRRERPLVTRWRADAGRVLGVALVAVAGAGVGLDMVTNGVNAVWPLHDQFYTVDGKAVLSDQRGFVQTFVDLSPDPPDDGGGATRTTENTRYVTGVNPGSSDGGGDPERIFPLVRSGWQLLAVVAAPLVVGTRLWEARADGRERED